MPSEASTDAADQQLGQVVNELKLELESKSRELFEARQEQAATAEILAVISRSPTDAQQAFAAIAKSAARICQAYDAMILLPDGDVLRLAAHERPIPVTVEGTVPLVRGILTARAFLDRRTIHVADLQAEKDEYPDASELARRLGHRTLMAVPLIYAGDAIGVICLRRTEVRPFTKRQIELVNTFADQAVIAIENTRLFEAEQARTRELQEALEHQTATGEVLSVISRSAFDLRPVLEAVIETATKLCGATRGHIFQFDGEFLRFAAAHGAWPGLTVYLEKHPLHLGTGSLAGAAASERRTVHALDVLELPDFQHGELLRQQPYRTVLAVPMLREDAVLGVICVLKSKMEAFTDKHIKLVETFADQAVIAIANAHLFEEVQARTHELARSVEGLKALGEVGQAVSSSLELNVVLPRILEHACVLSDTEIGRASW